MTEQSVPVDKIFAAYGAHLSEVTEKMIMLQAALSVANETIDKLNEQLDKANKDNK